jgi:hypothetical protein
LSNPSIFPETALKSDSKIAALSNTRTRNPIKAREKLRNRVYLDMLVMKQVKPQGQGAEYPKVSIEDFTTREIICQLNAVGVAKFDAD